jgi:hypothetical protein
MERHAQERQTGERHVKHETPHDPHEKDAPHVKKALGERSRLSLYRIGWFENWDSGQRSAPWLLWSPPEYPKARTDLVKQAEEVKDRILRHRKLSPDVFLQTKDGRVFRPRLKYGNPEKRKIVLTDHIEEIMRNENITREKLAENGSVPSTKAPKLKNIQKNRKEYLKECAEELHNWVLMPLQKIMIACLIEAYRDRVGLGELKDCGRHSRGEWKRTVELADRLLRRGVVYGKPLDAVLKMARGESPSGEVSAPIFGRVPEAIANGLEAALKLYLPKLYLTKNEAGEENPPDHSRNRILKEAKPTYFSWRAARLMYKSAVQNESLEELAHREIPGEHSNSLLEDGPSEDNSSENNSSESNSLDEKKSSIEKEQKSADERDSLTSEEFYETLFTNYQPSPGAEKVLESILKSLEEGAKLREYTKIGNMIYKAMNYRGLVEKVRPSNPVDTLRKDIKREIEKKGFGEEKMGLVWPRESQDPSKIVDLALKYSEYSRDD